jgi:hypothetical protein
MQEPKRINLRVDADLYEKLDDKRHAERTTFQAVGMELFRQWLGAEKKLGMVVAETQPNAIEQSVLALASRLSPENLRTLKSLAEILANGRESLLISALRSLADAYRVQSSRTTKEPTEKTGDTGPGRKAS